MVLVPTKSALMRLLLKYMGMLQSAHWASNQSTHIFSYLHKCWAVFECMLDVAKLACHH
jgi:hypothetical protein